MDKVHEMIEQLAEKLFKLFPDGTKAGITIQPDGYMYLSVEKWDHKDGVPIEDTPRKELWDQSRFEGEWMNDRSSLQNDYYKRCGCLLEED